MTQRKGQAIINWIRYKRLPELYPNMYKRVGVGSDMICAFTYEAEQEHLETVIFHMPDEEFDRILAADWRGGGSLSFAGGAGFGTTPVHTSGQFIE